jgi:hypothetical protein
MPSSFAHAPVRKVNAAQCLESLMTAFRRGHQQSDTTTENKATGNNAHAKTASKPSVDITPGPLPGDADYVCDRCTQLTTILEDERAHVEALRKQVDQLAHVNSTLEFNEQQALLSLRAMKHEEVSERKLMVDRFRNSIMGATMKTEGILGRILPGEVYRTQPDDLEQVSDEERMLVEPLVLPQPVVPRMLVIENGFKNDAPVIIAEGNPNGNKLGGNVPFVTRDAAYIVPHANETPEEFAYYGAHLMPVGSAIQFQTPQVVPYMKMVIGERYVENYLLNEDFGGGFYIEYHSCPHYHQPLNAEAKGWLILGKFTDDKGHIRLSAFKIPFGYGVYMPPNILHCDAFLTGDYLVAYTAAKEYKTGIFRHGGTDQLTNIRIWDEFSQKTWGLETNRRKSFIVAPRDSSAPRKEGLLRESFHDRRHRQNSTEYHNFNMQELLENAQDLESGLVFDDDEEEASS